MVLATVTIYVWGFFSQSTELNQYPAKVSSPHPLPTRPLPHKTQSSTSTRTKYTTKSKLLGSDRLTGNLAHRLPTITCTKYSIHQAPTAPAPVSRTPNPQRNPREEPATASRSHPPPHQRQSPTSCHPAFSPSPSPDSSASQGAPARPWTLQSAS